MENASLFRTTLVTVAAMLAAFTLFVGTLSVVAVVVTTRAVNPDADVAKDQASAKPQLSSTAKS
jgi:hypothetical protein